MAFTSLLDSACGFQHAFCRGNPVSWPMSGFLADPPVAEQSKVSVDDLTKRITRRKFLGCSVAAIAGLAVYSAEVSRHEISIVTQDLVIQNLPPAFQGFRVAQISDIHYDEYTEPAFLRRVIHKLNDLQPDMVMLTGDFISFVPLPRNFAEYAIRECAKSLEAITCPLRFAVMGNHDSFLGAPEVKPILADHGVPMLVNEHAPIARSGQHIWLAGTHDPVTHIPDLDATIPQNPDAPVLLMCHGPDYADTLVRHPRGHLVDAMFSGHTHGGQIRLPFLPPTHLPLGGKKYVEGLFRIGHLQLYVNRGIGAVGLPFRLNCPPEITLFTLKNA